MLAEQKVICIVLRVCSRANLEAVAFHLKAVCRSLSHFLFVAPTNIPKTPLSVIELNSRGRIPVAMAAAAATPSWQPQEQGFKEICGLLEQQISHSSSADKAQIWQHLQRYSHLPDFNNYLAFIFSRAEVFLRQFPLHFSTAIVSAPSKRYFSCVLCLHLSARVRIALRGSGLIMSALCGALVVLYLCLI